MQSAWCATRAKGTYVQSQFLRLKARRGPRKAITAVAASILTAIYAMLKNGVEYAKLGANHFSRADRVKTANRLLRKLGDLGFEVRDMHDRTAA